MTRSVPASETRHDTPAQPVVKPSRTSRLSFSRIGAVYTLIGLAAIFAVLVPSTFLTWTTLTQILFGNAVTALAALSLIVPLSARVFDLSIGGTITLSGVVATQLIVAAEVPVAVAVLGGVVVGLLVGVLNATVVVLLRVDSFVATLATGALLAAFVTMVTNDVDVTGVALADGFATIGQTEVLGLTLPVYIALAVALALGYLLGFTPFGRRAYATGFNIDAARVAGVPVARVRFVSLLISGGLAGVTGVVLASTLTSGSVTAGTPYLLSAFAAAFLGATQFRPGRFNAAGTIVAVLLLGTGVVGLSLAEAPGWAHDIFTGVILIVALVASRIQRRSRAAGAGAA